MSKTALSETKRYQPYPEYKDSGVEWIGEIPTEWEMWKLSHAYREIGSGTTPPTTSDEWFGGDIPWVTTGELRETVINGTKKNISKKAIETFSALRVYPMGSIAMAMYGATIGRLGIFGVDATTNQACCVMTSSGVIDNKYLFYWLWAFRRDIINLSSGGGQPNINQEKVASLKISVPMMEEQTQIANFLDHETAKIDTLIEKQQQLIKLLKEKRQAVISHAVTKGLNPDAPMKDSGVEWLGEVPEHWKLVLFKYLVSQMGGATPDKGNVSFWNGNIPWVSPKDMKVDYISTSQDFITDVAVKNSSTKLVPDQSILMVVRGMILIHSIPVALTTRPVTINQDMKALIPNKEIQPEFLLFFLKGIKDYILDFVETSAHGTKCLRTEDFENMCLFIPPIDEQVAILSSIKTSLDKLDLLIQKAETAIELLKERRTALISAAVTGKIDVRNWQNIHVKKEEEAS